MLFPSEIILPKLVKGLGFLTHQLDFPWYCNRSRIRIISTTSAVLLTFVNCKGV